MHEQAQERIYFAIDMKSFFASVECAERGLDPMVTNLVVADASRTEKTICLAVTPAMKKLGVKNRCRMFEIPQNIDFIIAKPRMKKYIEYASEIYAIYLKYVSKDDIHVYSIDESFIDATDYLSIYKMEAKEFAVMLMNEIKEKLQIPSSAGIGTNLYLAKIALDITAKKSDDGIGFLDQKKFIKELSDHRPITDFWQISIGTAERLKKYGIFDMRGIRTAYEDALYKEFGVNAELLIDHACGIETCLMSDIKNYKSKSRSISNSQILPYNYNFADALLVLKEMVEEGCYRLARANLSTESVHIYVAYGDGIRSSTKGGKRLHYATNLYSHIVPEVEKIFRSIVNRNMPIRKLAYDFSGLVPSSKENYDLFTDMTAVKKEKSLVDSVLYIKDKYGKNAILRGADYQENARAKERNKMIGGHSGGENENAEDK